jgi:hypothetical protein
LIKNEKSLGEQMEFYLFDVYFDSTVFLENGSTPKAFNSFNFGWDLSNTSNPTGSIPICLGNSKSKCPRMPLGLLNVAHMFQINCMNRVIPSKSKQGYIITFVEGYGKKKLIYSPHQSSRKKE